MAGAASLTDFERRVVKALFAKGLRNQDIHAWVNAGRTPSVNFARIAFVKKNGAQQAATEDEVAYFFRHREAYDSGTGLNPYDHERLVRARESMILAVEIFNSPSMKFKTEVFCILANIAWTYLMHEYYTRKAPVEILKPDGKTLALSEMIDRGDCPLSDGIKQNLKGLKVLRDKVEHHLLGKGDNRWFGMFQACCLNFDRTICQHFGQKLTLASDLSFALQFARMNLEQLVVVSKYEVPAEIEAIDAQVTEGMTPEQLNDTEFQFQVVYTMTSSPKSKAHLQFLNPDSAEGKEIQNVLTKKVIADDQYPHKPGKVIELVKKRIGKPFTNNDHTRCWKLYKVRPKKNAPQPENTDRTHCIFHKAHGDYTYSDEWVTKLVAAMKDPAEVAKVKAVKLA